MDIQQAFSQLDEIDRAIKEIDHTIKEGSRKSETFSQYNSFANQRMGLIEYIRKQLSEEAIQPEGE